MRQAYQDSDVKQQLLSLWTTSESSPHLGASQLQVGAVHISAQQLIEGRVARQNDGLVSPLNAPAAHTCSSQHRHVQGGALQARSSVPSCPSTLIAHDAQ